MQHKPLIRTMLLAAAAIFALSMNLSAQLSTGKVEGTVRDKDTGQPISGVQVKVEGTGIQAAVKAIEQSDFSKWSKEKYPKEMRPIAESYYFNRLMAKAGLKIKPDAQTSIKPTKEEFGNMIAFVGKYKDWMAIKKLGLEKAKDYEISGILSGINFTLVNKSFSFAGMENEVSGITKGKRKSYGAVVECLGKIENPSPYVVCKVLEELGFRPYASSHMLTEASPDIKPPKVKGRKPKG